MNVPFDPSRFPPPLYLVISCKQESQPDMVSLLNESIRVPEVRGQGFSCTPLFTSRHQAETFTESVNIPHRKVLEIKDLEDLVDILRQLKAIGRTQIAFDPPKESDQFSVYSTKDILDEIS